VRSSSLTNTVVYLHIDIRSVSSFCFRSRKVCKDWLWVFPLPLTCDGWIACKPTLKHVARREIIWKKKRQNFIWRIFKPKLYDPDKHFSEILLIALFLVKNCQCVQCLTTGWTATVRSAANFSFNLCVQNDCEPHPAFDPVSTCGPFPGVEARPGCDADHSPPSSVENKNEYSPHFTRKSLRRGEGVTVVRFGGKVYWWVD
jgi:hypothetical protein